MEKRSRVIVTAALWLASVLSQPLASLAVSTPSGWDTTAPSSLNFGAVPAGTTVGRQIRLCNEARDSSPLTITRSQPPRSPQLAAINPDGELFTGQVIPAGQCASATVAVFAAPGQPNHPPQHLSQIWILGTNAKDAANPTRDFGIRGVRAEATIISRQVGPKLANGTARFQWTGCFRDTPGRNLAVQVNSEAAQLRENTNGRCQEQCFARGYVLAGTEYRQECWCGNAVANPASYRPDSWSGGLDLCTLPCPGDATEACGGEGGYLSLYADATRFDIAAFLSSIPPPPASPSSTQPSSPGASSGPSPGELWSYIGCFLDNTPIGRTLPSKTWSSSSMTLEACASFCTGHNFFGTEYSRECFCGYSLPSSLRAASESDCSSPCSGNPAQRCGSPDRLSVYKNSASYPVPETGKAPPRAGNYVWIGCYSEVPGRALNGPSRASDDMTTGQCAIFCAGEGMQLMGVEYGRECFCGQKLASQAALQDPGACSMPCAGNKQELCGAADRLGVYTYSPARATARVVEIAT